MDNIILYIMITGGLIVVWLIIKVALLNARLEGHREAQQRMINGDYDNGTGYGWLKVLAAIGFLTVCGLCFYIGLAISAWAK